jgi:hypothetical protein
VEASIACAAATAFDDYEVVIFEIVEKALFEPQSRRTLYTAVARATTEMAKKVRIPPGEGPTEQRARSILHSAGTGLLSLPSIIGRVRAEDLPSVKISSRRLIRAGRGRLRAD